MLLLEHMLVDLVPVRPRCHDSVVSHEFTAVAGN